MIPHPLFKPEAPPRPEAARVSEACINLVTHFEGFRAHAYLCPALYWTIGIGAMLRPYDKARDRPPREMDGNPHPEGVSLAWAQARLRRDLARYEAHVRRLCPVPLTQGQFDALVSFTFNLGPGNLQASTLRRRVLAGRHGEAAEEFGRWVYAGGRRLPGLVRRREAEANLYRGAVL